MAPPAAHRKISKETAPSEATLPDSVAESSYSDNWKLNTNATISSVQLQCLWLFWGKYTVVNLHAQVPYISLS